MFLLGAVALGVPAVGETKNKPQEIGDELVAGHDITRVRYTNRTGSFTAKTWVGTLHDGDRVSLMIATNDVPDYNYLVGAKLVHGEARGKVRTFTFGTSESTVTCKPTVRFDFRHDTVTIRATDDCFPGSDLSRILVSTGLGVRGYNYLSDMTKNVPVHRD